MAATARSVSGSGAAGAAEVAGGHPVEARRSGAPRVDQPGDPDAVEVEVGPDTDGCAPARGDLHQPADGATRVAGRPGDGGSEGLLDLAAAEGLEAGEVLDDGEPRVGELDQEAPVGQRVAGKAH